MNKNVHIMNEEEIRRLDEIKSHFILRNMETGEIISMDDLYKIVPDRFYELTIRTVISKFSKIIERISHGTDIPSNFSLELQIKDSKLSKAVVAGDSDFVDEFRTAVQK